MKSCKVKGFGYAKAKKSISNDDIAQVVDTSDEWIYTRTGIKSRYVSEQENTSDLACRAAKQAMLDANIDKSEVDLIIVATFTPDYMTPSTACILQGKLGMNEQPVMAFDINAACSGFLYALQCAHSMLAMNQATCALVVGAEVISKQMDWQDRSTCIIFADGAGALVLKQEECDNRMLHFSRSKGDLAGIIRCDAPLPKQVFKPQSNQPNYVSMNGSETFRFAVKAMQESMEALLDDAKVKMEDIDWVIPHQANARIIRNVCKHMHIPMEKVYMNIAECGNTSAASIPLALGEMREKKLLKEGMKIMLTGFGAGFTWAGTYIEL